MTPEQVYEIAFGLYKGGKQKEALGMFRLLSQACPNQYDYRFGFGACLQLERKYPAALSQYEKCTLLDPSNPYPLVHIAECYLALNDLDKMEVYLKRAKLIALKDKKFEDLINKLSLWEAAHDR